MVMSVGTCECGCGEFDHEVGGVWEELDQPAYDNWARHQCTKQCPSPCLVARCRDGFDGDGFWVWCSNCDIQCSGQWESWSDEPNEEGVEVEAISAIPDRGFRPGIEVGDEIRVIFSNDPLIVTDLVVLPPDGDPTRRSNLDNPNSYSQVYAVFATTRDGFEVLVEAGDINQDYE